MNPSQRTPTPKQYENLLSLASGAVGLSRTKRNTDSLLRWGWVTAEWREPYYQWVRITPDGLRAVASGVERYGLPEMDPKTATARRRVCADCGSSSYRIEYKTAEQLGVAA